MCRELVKLKDYKISRYILSDTRNFEWNFKIVINLFICLFIYLFVGLFITRFVAEPLAIPCGSRGGETIVWTVFGCHAH